MSTQFLFTSGHVSVKRGRVTRKYIPTPCSVRRLCNLSYYGPCDDYSTNRSTIHTWHGLSTLNPCQHALYQLFVSSIHFAENYPTNANWHYSNGVRQACLVAGIHEVLLDFVTPCEHGNAKSKCYTCATMM